MPTETVSALAKPLSRQRWTRGVLLILATALGLAACASPPASPPDPAPVARTPVTTAPASEAQPVPVVVVELPPEVSTVPASTPEPAAVPNPWLAGPGTELPALLEQAERLRTFTVNELQAHIAALGDAGNQPARQMQLAMALTFTHQPPDTARALGLLQRVINHTAPESAAFKSLARLLASRLMDQRRLEDTVERQAQQLREGARRIDQLNERLEAMRAIERSLMPRPPGSGANGIRISPP